MLRFQVRWGAKAGAFNERSPDATFRLFQVVVVAAAIGAGSSVGAQSDAPPKPPPLPGPGLDLPVDTDGDGDSTFGDRYFFNYWLSLGGDLGKALNQATVVGDLIDLSAFFASADAQIVDNGIVFVADSPVESSADGGEVGVLGGGGGMSDNIDFTRRIPPDVVPDRDTFNPRATPDGRFFVFESSADLGLGRNGFRQIYRVEVDDRDVSTITLVSMTSIGGLATAGSSRPSISNDGKVVAFESDFAFVAIDTNLQRDVYVRDFRSDPPVTRLISRAADGGPIVNEFAVLAYVSGNGNVVAFVSSAWCQLTPQTCDPGVNFGAGVFRVGTDGATPPMELLSVDTDGSVLVQRKVECSPIADRYWTFAIDNGERQNLGRGIIHRDFEIGETSFLRLSLR